MRSRVPPDAFGAYLAMGERRSYAALAKELGVSKAAVTNRAVREKWAEKLVAVEREQRTTSEKKAVETLDEMTERHVKIARAIQVRAYEALKNMSIPSASAAIRALVESVKLECTLRGQPSERSAVSIEEKLRQETEHWFPEVTSANGAAVKEREDDDDEIDADEDDAAA